MHRPPAVSYKVVRSRWHFFVIVILWSLALAGALAWVAQQGAVWQSVVFAMVLLVSAVWSLHGWYRTCPGLLQWDGEDWYGPTPRDAIGADASDLRALRQVHVVFDFQAVVLVRTANQLGQTAWIWLERATDPDHWLRMRRALVGSAQGSMKSPVTPPPSLAGDA